MKSNQVAKYVRVKLNSNFQGGSLADKHMLEEPIIFIDDSHIYNDQVGEWVYIKGGSMTNSTTAYLTELDLEFPIGERPLYNWEEMKKFKENWNRDELIQHLGDARLADIREGSNFSLENYIKQNL